MHHGGAFHFNLLALHQFAVGRRSVVGQVGRRHAVGKEQKLACFRADFRVRRHAGFEFAVVIVGADGFQIRRQFKWPVAFFQRQDLSRMADNVRVGERF